MTLIFLRRSHDIPDQKLAAFLNELRPHSLESFETWWCKGFGSKCIQALSCHGESLTTLKLDRVPSRIAPELSLLKGCTNLVEFSFSFSEITAGEDYFEKTHNDAFLEIVAWLKERKKLRILAFETFVSAPALMTAILPDINIRLTSITYDEVLREGPRIQESFFRAVASQTSLQSLWLEGGVQWNKLDADDVAKSLSKLVNLTYLRFGVISEIFRDRHIVHLARSLLKLEVWLMDGLGLTDAIWSGFTSLKFLRILIINGLGSSMVDGILGFVEGLGPGDKGLLLAIPEVQRDSEISAVWEDRLLINDKIAQKVEGTFEIEFYRYKGEY